MEMIKGTFKEENIQFETECWRRTLDFVSAECVHCKNHLASLVSRSDRDKKIIDLSEDYLNGLLQTEVFIRWLRQVIADDDRLGTSSANVTGGQLVHRDAIRIKLLQMQKDFYNMRAALITHLAEST